MSDQREDPVSLVGVKGDLPEVTSRELVGVKFGL